MAIHPPLTEAGVFSPILHKNGTLPQKSTIYSDIYFNGNTTDRRSVRFTNYLDRLILQSLTEITLKAHIAYFADLPLGIGLCGLVGGYDDSSTTYDAFTGDIWACEDLIEYYTRLRYLAKNYSDGLPDGVSYNTNKTTLTVTNDFIDGKLDLADFASTVKNVKASALKRGIKIVGNALNNSIVGGSGNDSISGGDGNDKLSGGKGNDSLSGGAGKDSLSGGTGNDSLTGGKGNDVFIYSAGKDVITDYAAGDKISLGAAISKSTVNGSNVVFTIGSGTLTVKDGQGKTLTLINANGKEYTTVVSGAKNLKITDKTSSPVTLAADIATANASTRTKAIKIVGNKLDNVILGGSKNDSIYGESGNDSLVGNAGNDNLNGGFGSDTLKGGAGNDKLLGGAGNDSLWGDAGADIFVYNSGDGNDVIYGFDSKDTLTLDSMDFTATYKNKAVTIKFDEGSITLKDFTATTFHVNDDTYKISGTKLVRSEELGVRSEFSDE